LALPIKRFWLLDKNISRLAAVDRLQSLDLLIASQGKEGYDDMRRRLVHEIGTVTLEAPKLDRRGLDFLKNMQ